MKKFFALFFMFLSLGIIGLLYNVQATDVLHLYDVSTESELRSAVRKNRSSFDKTIIRLQNDITCYGDLDLVDKSLTLDLNYHSLSFVESKNGIIINGCSWNKINIQNGRILGAIGSHSALNPRGGHIDICNVSIYGGDNYSNSSNIGHAISLRNSHSWTEVYLDYVLLVSGNDYVSSKKANAIEYVYCWNKNKIKSKGHGYTVQS